MSILPCLYLQNAIQLWIAFSAFSELYFAYKYLVTLSVTQVECERTFSTLKFLKNRLRSTINQSHLEALILIYLEKAVVNNLDVNEIINIYANTSEELKRLLVG